MTLSIGSEVVDLHSSNLVPPANRTAHPFEADKLVPPLSSLHRRREPENEEMSIASIIFKVH